MSKIIEENERTTKEIIDDFMKTENYALLKEALCNKRRRAVCNSCVWGFSGVCIMPACKKAEASR